MSYITIKEAATEYKLTETEIQTSIDNGTIKTTMLKTTHGDKMILLKKNVAGVAVKKYVTRNQFKHLENVPITISDASINYRLNANSLRQWVLNGAIKQLGLDPNHKTRWLINEADVAYIAKLIEYTGVKPGRAVLNNR